MPTGYTYGVQEGKITTLEDYAKECARAFLWQARDSSEKDLIKLVTEVARSDHHKTRMLEATAEYNNLLNYTEIEWKSFHKKEVDKDIVALNESVEKLRVEKERYESMMDKVKSWTPPTGLHEGLKKFMLEQLEQSYKFDCVGYTPSRSVSDDLEVFKKKELDAALNDIEFHLKYMKKDDNQNNESVQWVEQLLESVKGK